MKKIFLISLLAGFISSSFAQSSVTDVPENKVKPVYQTASAIKPTDPKAIAVEKPLPSSVIANAHGNPAQLKTTSSVTNQQPSPVVSTAPSHLVSITATMEDMPAQVTQRPVSTTPASVKPAIIQSVVPAPATKVIPAGSLKTSVPMQAPAATKVTDKLVEVNGNAASGKLVPRPTLTLANGVDISPVVATPIVTAQQIAGQPKAAEVVITPPSIINAPKAPAKKN